jgi:hypothetical protein
MNFMVSNWNCMKSSLWVFRFNSPAITTHRHWRVLAITVTFNQVTAPTNFRVDFVFASRTNHGERD